MPVHHDESLEKLVLASGKESAATGQRGKAREQKALCLSSLSLREDAAQGGSLHIHQGGQHISSGEAPHLGNNNLWQVGIKINRTKADSQKLFSDL